MRLLGLLVGAGIAVWVYFDARRRDAGSAGKWAVGTFFGLIVLPFYVASRPLLPGEVRRGGWAWNVFRNLAILFGIIAAIVITIMGVAMTAAVSANPSVRVQQALGPTLLMSAIALSPAAIMLLLGLSYRRRDVIERDDRPAADATFDRNTGETRPPTKISWQPIAVLGVIVALGVMFALG